MPITPREAAEAWSRADLLHSAAAVELALDRMASAISERLSEGVRDSDVLHRSDTDDAVMDLSRMGGDEFTVVLNQIESLEAAITVAQRLADGRDAISHNLLRRQTSTTQAIDKNLATQIHVTLPETVLPILRIQNTAREHVMAGHKPASGMPFQQIDL